MLPVANECCQKRRTSIKALPEFSNRSKMLTPRAISRMDLKPIALTALSSEVTRFRCRLYKEELASPRTLLLKATSCRRVSASWLHSEYPLPVRANTSLTMLGNALTRLTRSNK